MKAIAEDSGFNSMPTFNNLFKKKTGMTPFEFKSAQKNRSYNILVISRKELLFISFEQIFIKSMSF